MGFGESFKIGTKLKAENIASERADKQQELTAMQAGYTYNPETESFEPTRSKELETQTKEAALEATLQATQTQVQSMQSQQSADGITETINSITEGNWEDANFA